MATIAMEMAKMLKNWKTQKILMGMLVTNIFVCWKGHTQSMRTDWLLCLSTCQMRADDNSSTHAFKTGKSYYLDNKISVTHVRCKH
jgi:hypothetical protein